jgi:hypothetical protein
MNWTGVTNSPIFTTPYGNQIFLYGNLTLSAGMTVNGANYPSSLNFVSTQAGKTITTNGVDIKDVAFNGVGGSWTFQDNFTSSDMFYINAGTVNTNNVNVSVGALVANSGNAGPTNNTSILNLGSSTVTITGGPTSPIGGTTLCDLSSTSFTLNAGTSTFVMTNANGVWRPRFAAGNKTLYNLNFTGTGSAIAGSATLVASGATFNNVSFAAGGSIDGGSNTFNNVTFTSGNNYTLASNQTQTINVSLNATGTAGAPISLSSTSSGTPAIISKALGTSCMDFISLQDITATGGAIFNAGTHSTNVSGNTGFIFTGSCVVSSPKNWVGASSTDWSSASNWADNAVPLTSNDVVIPKTTTNQPIISSTTNAVVKNLSINSGASLKIAGILTPSGTITNTGTLIVAPGGALVGSASNVSGSVTVQQNIVGQRGWRVFGNPFSSNLDIATVASTNGITIGTTVPNSGITDSRTNSYLTGQWSNVVSPTNSWNSGILYSLFIRGLASEVSGTNYTGGPTAFVYNVSGTISNSTLGRNQSAGVFRVIGNPYTAPINSSALTAQTANVPYYTYKIAVTGTPRVKSGAWVASSSNSSATTTIPVMGALCYMPTSSTQFNISTSDINTTGTMETGIFNTGSSIQQIEINLNKGNDFADKLFIRTDAMATINGQDRFDLPKFENESSNFYTIAPDNTHLAVDARKEWDQKIPLGIHTEIGNYSIAVEKNSLPLGSDVYLKDKLLNVLTELKAGAQYNFAITSDTTTQGEKRFEIFFTKSSSSLTAFDVPSNTGLSMSVLGNVVNGNVLNVQVNGLKADEVGSLSIIDLNGRIITTKNASNGLNRITINNAFNGVHLIQLSNGKNLITQKFIKD